MTKEEYQNLNNGDVLESVQTKSRYVVIHAKNAGEPLTQIKKDDIKTRIEQFDIVVKVQPKDEY
jgi:hypothetical protein